MKGNFFDLETKPIILDLEEYKEIMRTSEICPHDGIPPVRWPGKLVDRGFYSRK